MKIDITTLEELTMNALPANEVHQLDGWYLRYTNGFTKRANSIYPLEHDGQSLDECLSICEKWYKIHQFSTVFKMTETSKPSGLDDFLQANNYFKHDETIVQVLSYERYLAESIDIRVIYNEQFNDHWFDHVCSFNQIEEQFRKTFKDLLLRIKANVCYALVLDEKNKVLSCGLGVLEADFFGLYDIVTNPNFRNQGIGRKLVHGLLQWGKEKGAKYAYLQVLKENAPARHLYEKIGFEEAYTYWYRIKDKEV